MRTGSPGRKSIDVLGARVVQRGCSSAVVNENECKICTPDKVFIIVEYKLNEEYILGEAWGLAFS